MKYHKDNFSGQQKLASEISIVVINYREGF